MRIKKKKLTWNPSSSPDVAGYKLYWSESGNADYGSDHMELGRATQVVIPDGIPSFPRTAGRIYVGITSVSSEGNESDMARAVVQFEYSYVTEKVRPAIEGWEPPRNAPILIDGLNRCVIEQVTSGGTEACHTRYFFVDTYYHEKQPFGMRRPLESTSPWV